MKLTMETKQKLESAIAKFENEISIYQMKSKELQHNLVLARSKKSEIMERLKKALKEYQQADGSQNPSSKKYDNDELAKRITSVKKVVLDRRSDSLNGKEFKTTSIILRPSKTRQNIEFGNFMKNKLTNATDKDLIQAEEFYLLALHPSCESELPTLPSNQEWAEPGYQLLHQTNNKGQVSKETNSFAQSNVDFATIKGCQL